MRRVVVQVTCTLHETVDLDDWCGRVHATIRDSVRADTRNVQADDDSIAVFVIRTYEAAAKHTKHARVRGKLRNSKDETNGDDSS